MATGPMTQISDLIVPEVFTGYVQQLTERKSRIIQSGVAARSPILDAFLAGAGLTINVPSLNDLDDDADNVSTDDVSDVIAADFGAGTPAVRLDSTPFKVGTSQEVATRLSRNGSWASADLAAALAGEDPLDMIAQRVSNYWTKRLQTAFIATWNGVIKDNTANDAGDYTNDISGAAYVAGVTDFSAEALIDTAQTMGDSSDQLSAIFVHSLVKARMMKNNLIDFIPDSRGETMIATFLGYEVITDDSMPATGSVYDTWMFAGGATQLGTGSPKVPTAVKRYEEAGNGGGNEVLFNRVEWSIHPTGHAYTGTCPSGGPGNGTGANQLNAAASWNRVYPERKQIKFARLVTREA
jgi:hypothetical protein